MCTNTVVPLRTGRYFTPYNKENSTILIDNEEVPFGNKIIFQNDNYLKEISEFNILELSRTGITAMERGDKIPTIDLTDNY